MMLVLLTFGALVSQVSPAASPPRDQVIRSLDQNACSLVVCGPAQNGLPGRDGRDGIQGPKGEVGGQGLQGLRGIPGPPGKMGPAGPVGAKGAQGEKGAKGDIGPRGVQGVQGPPGSTGPAGAKGSSGPQGEKGVKGETGPRGSTGAQGPQGQKGAPGPQGIKGSVGEKGAKGDVGPRGLPGPTGVQGPVGKTGPFGSKGDKGSIGEKGAKGDSGLSEVNLMKKQVSTLEGQLKALQASFSKYQKVAMFPGGRIVGNKVFITTGYEGNFDDLKQRCLQAGGQLASPRNAAENTAVQQIAALYNKIVFLGITDLQSEGKFKYLNGDAISYSNWLPGEPNNDKNREHCVEVFANGKWNDKVCSERRLIVCEF
ncbi:pulmonary surfactant-associated protein D-like [Varanus komodoensis]|uniref:Surfactant protein D n=1 Tax=Varanus komodoensis TaxID=61221 RepID=A0A8D2KVW9_VARKO|nr:pulmonary surfactant-associated protein D-like [Varanus komodoensis]XP_044276255.1 pulmonary surfactant-associated protein D-like [Varanus komodoensis]